MTIKESGVVDKEFTVTLIVVHEVELQLLSALIKYVVVNVGVTTKVSTLPINVPPHEPLYQNQEEPGNNGEPAVYNFIAFPGQVREGFINTVYAGYEL
jgi:hypothetical protein